MSTPAARLRSFIVAKFGQQKLFANALKMNPANLSKYLDENGSVFKNGEIQKKFHELGLNYKWYLTGEGEMELAGREEGNVKLLQIKGTEEDLVNLAQFEDMIAKIDKMENRTIEQFKTSYELLLSTTKLLITYTRATIIKYDNNLRTSEDFNEKILQIMGDLKIKN